MQWWKLQNASASIKFSKGEMTVNEKLRITDKLLSVVVRNANIFPLSGNLILTSGKCSYTFNTMSDERFRVFLQLPSSSSSCSHQCMNWNCSGENMKNARAICTCLWEMWTSWWWWRRERNFYCWGEKTWKCLQIGKVNPVNDFKLATEKRIC